MKFIKFFALFVISLALFSCGGKGEGFAPSLDLSSQVPTTPSPTYDPIAISPATYTLAANNQITFTATGGDGTYTYSVFSGGGSVLTTTGAYTAPASAGSAVVRVTDGQGSYADATITIHAALEISPATLTIVTNNTSTFSAIGGVSPFTYSMVSGVGSVDASTGLYSAGGAEGAAVVRVTDSLGNTSDATITVSNTLAIAPASPAYVVINGSLQLSATGGVAPYTFSCTNGTITDPAVGDYTAPGTAGSDTCTVTDNVGTTSNTNLTIYNTFLLSPLDVTKAVGTTQQFTATGGVGALTWSLVSGSGSINSSGLYTAPAFATTAVIQVSDTIGNALQTTITVVSSLTITPRDIYLPLGSTATYTGTLGTAPYTFSVVSGGGSIVGGTGVYTAATTAGTGVVRVTDNIGTTDNTNVYHVTPVDIAGNWGYHYCALYSSSMYTNYKLKCWGTNANGQLGYEDTNNRGDASAELGYGLKYVNVGTGLNVKKVSVGWNHTCAILDNDKVKCWGLNTSGQLGYGNTTQLGSATGQMGDNLPYVNLGTGRTAKEIYAFGYRSCAILDNDQTKCWGLNDAGQLGQGNTTNYGSGANQMGDSLPAINLGTGKYAVKLAGGEAVTCAILNDGKVKCWGLGMNQGIYTFYGELGLGTANKTWGDGAGEMGDALPFVDLNQGANTVTDISAGRQHVCALLSTGSVKCWGRNRYGELGYDSTTTIGDGASEMGTFLANVNLGTTATSLKLMRYASCAVLTGGSLKCWGYNRAGQLLKGNTTNYGDNGGEMAALTAMNLGTGRTVSKVASTYYGMCAILDNNRIKCWGAVNCISATSTTIGGCLLNGASGGSLGDAGTELGDSLPYVNH